MAFEDLTLQQLFDILDQYKTQVEEIGPDELTLYQIEKLNREIKERSVTPNSKQLLKG